MFGQKFTNTNEMLQCLSLHCADLGAANLAQLNTALCRTSGPHKPWVNRPILNGGQKRRGLFFCAAPWSHPAAQQRLSPPARDKVSVSVSAIRMWSQRLILVLATNFYITIILSCGLLQISLRLFSCIWGHVRFSYKSYFFSNEHCFSFTTNQRTVLSVMTF
jgi:hypothetical protein